MTTHDLDSGPHSAPHSAEVRAFAQRHGLTDEQAKSVLDEHGADESTWGESVRSLIHFLKAPS